MDNEIKQYKILCFGRHSDLINLGLSIKEELKVDETLDINVYSDRSIIDGQSVADLKVIFINPLKIIKEKWLNNNEIVHVISPSGMGLMCAICNKLKRGRVIYNVHRFDFLSFKGLKSIKVFIYTLVVFLFSDIVFVHSDKTKRFLFWKKKIIYAELPEYNFKDFTINTLLPGDEFLFFGRIDSNKGLDLFSKIAAQMPSKKFRVCGELVDKKLQNTVDKLIDQKNVTVEIGRIDQDKIPDIFQNAKCVLLPYSDGTQSGIPFLARSLKTPVLVSDVGDLAATVSDSMYGKSLSSQNANEWVHLLENTDWHELRKEMHNHDDKHKNDTVYKDVLNTL